MSFYREALNGVPGNPPVRITAALRRIPSGRRVRVAGLVILRQRPSTAKGVTFVTLEDETGTANLLIHPRTWEKFYQAARNSNAWIVTGRLERKAEVAHVIVSRIEDLASTINVTSQLAVKSRDFR